MRKMNQLQVRYVFLITIMLLSVNEGYGQTALPDELIKGTIKEQISFIDKNTRIYENFRAIREDMFQKINRNCIDSLADSKTKIAALNSRISVLIRSNDSLNSSLETERITLKEVTRTKNEIKIFGLEINKGTYNSIMFTILAVLLALLLIGLFAFLRILFLSNRTQKDLEEQKIEFEVYRQTSRIAREKISMDHFNELNKLKGK